jgi:hypothetical protein
MKTHWLYGEGENKELHFLVDIDDETHCGTCGHKEVCDHEMEKRCSNYTFGTSQFKGCLGCLHRYTRYDKDSVPCFHCRYYLPVKQSIEAALKK